MSHLASGFADPPHDAQRLFRGVLDGFSHPGRIIELRDAPPGPGTICPATVAFLLTLADRDTPVWLEPRLDRPEIREFLRFHAGTPIVEQSDAATFAVLTGSTVVSLDDFATGSDTYPDRAATLIIEASALGAGPLRIWRGPGIDGSVSVAIDGVADDFWKAWAANHTYFPRGVDIVFTAGSRLLALPRSIAVES